MAITIAINGTITATDNLSGSVSLQKLLNLAYVGTIFEDSQFTSFGTSPTTVTLPIAAVQFLYFKNLSTTATITLTWTKTGGSSQTIITLDPGAAITFVENTTSNGISALSVTASVAATPAEFILAG